MNAGARSIARPPEPFRHVIWDWNGTILDDAGLCVEIMDGLLQARGLPGLTPARYAELFDFPVREYYRRLGFDFARDPFKVVGAEFMEVYERRRMECVLRPRARETVERLHDAGVGQTVLSAYRRDSLEELLVHFGLRDRFTHVIGGDDIYARGKREQAVEWIERAGIDRDTALLIGDTVHDAEVAAAMGVACVLVVSGHQSRARLLGTGLQVCDDPGDLTWSAPVGCGPPGGVV